MALPDRSNPRSRGVRLGSAALALAVVASVFAGCREETLGYTVVNDLDQRVRISQVFEGTEKTLERTPGGDMLDPRDEQTFHLNHLWDPERERYCEAIEVLARNDDGAVVARFASPVCVRDRIVLSSAVVVP